MKAFLVIPPTGLYIREDRCQSAIGDFTVSVIRPPMDLMFMASSLESVGIECRVRDYPVEGGNWKVFQKDFFEFFPDMLIVSVTTPTLAADLTACGIAKKINPSVSIIAKGAHFLENDTGILRQYRDLDIIIRGECEIVVKEIAMAKDLALIKGITYRDSNGMKRNAERPLLEKLDELSLPARHLVKNNLYTRPDTGEAMAVIETSRGCPGSCIFCLVGQVAGKKIRTRSPGSIADEATQCIERYGIRNFHFKSDTFTWNKNWVIELCKEIIGRNRKIEWICNSRVDTLDRERLEWMRRAGCWAIGLGIESGNQDILDRIKKGITLQQAREAVSLCREFGIKSYTYFIIGFPWDTHETIEDSVRFSIELDPDFVDFFLPYPFPGTELEERLGEYGVSCCVRQAKAYTQPMMDTQFLTTEKLLEVRKNALRRFYLRPGYVARTLWRCRSPKVAGNYVRYGLKTLCLLSRI